MARKTKKAAKTGDANSEPIETVAETAPASEAPSTAPTTGIEDPVGDVSDGEGKTYLGEPQPDAAPAQALGEGDPAFPRAAAQAEPEELAADDEPAHGNAETDQAETEAGEAETETGEAEAETDRPAQPQPPAKLERLQKILSQAGVASRRKAEEMIEQGRVQVNGTVITTLGAKADAGRDHIRVDGKLLHGAERHRYFVLNKPRGFVTTVRDPEGRPTVMQFFEKMNERLYPVGRLDYQSEGLLLVTNDGELANRLTKAGSGVEKTYLVKVAGQPTEQELDILRAGVAIERAEPGSSKVHTAPARVRQVREGDNPWYEVVLIEGRNRELRKMFSAIGHFVEKIRRVGYGPLVLDVEPGNLRELEPDELESLRQAAEGKLRTPKAKEVRRRNRADAQLPTVRPKPSPARRVDTRAEHSGRGDARPSRPFAAKSFEKGRPAADRSGESRPRRSFGTGKPYGSEKPFRPARPAAGDEPRPAAGRSYGSRPAAGRSYGAKPFGKTFQKPFTDRAAGRSFEGRPPRAPFAGKPASGKPAWKKPGGGDRPDFKRSAAPRHESFPPAENVTPRPPSRLRIDAAEPDRPGTDRPGTRDQFRSRPSSDSRSRESRPRFDRPKTGSAGFGRNRSGAAGADRPRFDRPRPERPASDRPRSDRPSSERGSYTRPRPERGSSAKPGFERPRFDRAGSGRPSGAGRTGSRPSTRPAGDSSARPPAKTGWKPKPSFGRSAKPGAGGSRPKSGGYSKPGFKGAGGKGKSGGPRRSGPRPGGKKRS